MASGYSSEDLEREVRWVKDMIQHVPLNVVRFEFLRSLFKGTKFSDPYFPPTDYSIYGGKKRNARWEIQWLRPEHFLDTRELTIFYKNIEQADINQGKLGNCWFMVAICSLADSEKYIRRLFDQVNYEPNGFYRIKLCKNGEWQTVTVDDWFPCDNSGNPIFSRSNGPELWVLLLEKAYAKLHGSYMALKGGFANEAFTDLTGCPSFSYRFADIENQILSGEFYEKLKMWYSQGFCLVGATKDIDEKSTGMVAKHYYSITRVADAYGQRLINLRNPWGEFEWKGDWCDGSSCWTQDMINAIRPSFQGDDGSFWMSYEDFSKIFMRVVLGKVKDWWEWRSRNLVMKSPLGGIAKEALVINVVYETNVIIGISQEDERTVGAKEYRKYLDLGIVLLRWNGSAYVFHASTDNNQQERDIYLELQLPPGTYLAVPISTGCSLNMPGDAEPEDFNLLTESGDMHPIFQSTIRDLFRRFDMDMSQDLDSNEFLQLTSRLGFTLQVDHFVEVILNKYTSTKRGVTLQGLYEMFITGVEDRGEEQMREWLSLLGYTKQLYSVESRALVFTIHADTALDVHRLDLSPETNLLAWSAVISAKGKQLCSRQDIELYILVHSAGCSFLLHNASRSVHKVRLDLSRSQNVDFAIDSPVSEFTIPGSTWLIAQHIQCVRSAETFNYGYTLEVLS